MVSAWSGLLFPAIRVCDNPSPTNAGGGRVVESPAATAADLKGMTLGVGAKRDAQAYLSSVLEAGGLKRSDVKVVDPGFAQVPALLAGRLHAAHTLTFSDQLTVTNRLKKEGRPPAKILLYSDYGVPGFYYTLLAANRDWLKVNSQTTCRFLEATLKGLKSVLANPEPTIDFVTKARPGALTMDENWGKWNAHKFSCLSVILRLWGYMFSICSV